MAEAISPRDHNEVVGAFHRVSKKLGIHEHTLRRGTMQLASAVESTVGGMAAASLDYFFGTPDAGGSGIPELMVGPVPVTPVVGVVAKLGAIALHVAARGNPGADSDVAASHLGNFADGILAGSASLGLMRLFINMKAPQVFAQTATAPTPSGP